MDIKTQKARAYSQENRFRKMRVAKYSSAAEAIGEIKKNSDTYVLTFGQFSLIDAIVAILDQIGPAEVVVSTWTANSAHLERSAELLEQAQITRMRLIVDRSFETCQPGYCEAMRRCFGADCFRFIPTHAKWALIRNEHFDIVLRTSMNLNENPRMENIEVSESREFAEFFQKIVEDIFSEVAENEKRWKVPTLASSPDTVVYEEVKAEAIPRENTMEPKATHTITKR